MATILDVKIMFTPKGVYDENTVYERLDFVTSVDSTYLYINQTPSKGKDVLNTDYWMCLADGKPATLASAYAEAQGDYAKAQGEAIQSDLGAKAFHGYASIEVAKTLKQVEDNASVKIENLVVNGDFRNGLTGWTIFGAPDTLSTTDKLIFNGVAANNGGVHTDIPSSINNKIYLKFKVTNEGETSPTIYIYDYDSFDNIATLSGAMETASTIFDSLLGGVRLRFRQISGNTYINVTIDDVICIDLTETFGAGNEPTEEETDLLISTLGIDYFEGEITIPAQKLMQWQLKLIRKNKNAIIALGGTII